MSLNIRTVLLGVLIASASFSSSSFAQDDSAKTTALGLYEKGNAQYNLGRWDRAINFFEEAYETYPAPAFLFNIGQAYRQSGNCKDAVFFYRRYLSLKPDASNRAEAEGFINDQVEVCKRKEDSKKRTPTGTVSPESKNEDKPITEPQARAVEKPIEASDTPDTSMVESKGPVASTDEEGHSEQNSPSLFVAHLDVGVASVAISDRLDIPSQLAMSIGIGYPMTLGPVLLDVGPLLTLTPFSFADASGAENPGSLTGLLVNVGVNYPITSKIDVRGNVGFGANIFGGITGENIFVDQGQEATGALTSFNFRFGLGGEYHFSQSLSANVSFAVSAAAAHEGLRDDIDGIGISSALLGLGYRR